MTDRSHLIGHTYTPYTFPVEHGKVREFAGAVKDDDPVYRDVEAARAAGYAHLPVPPTFSAVTSHWAVRDTDVLGLDLRRVLAGGSEWEYLGDVVAGEWMTVRSRIADVQYKTGSRGPMTLVITEYDFVNQHEETVLRLRSTVIELGEQ
ncbi:FAS1-like dehydratase domain-containing protein [Microtetraspora malaysiensis]|uniref:MaoC family dehydratase N-terminal domain-containing protein n=1 Tax=Microtetraspora malaysiensis TaxID=161358 RepID=A0ABW6T3F5_9ACTN|nr:MaoC family dehydratase N-terminal domain-containing protein [Microtetraspora malaysiensis]